MEVGRFRLLGGEPLLNRQLPEFIETLRASRITREVGLCTNGLLLHKTDPDVLRSLDWMDVSLYPGTTPDARTIADTARELSDRLGVRLHLLDKPEFRYQILDRPIEDPDTVQAIYDSCMMAHGGYDEFHDGCHTIYQGSYYRCNRPAYSRRYLDAHGSAAVEIPDFGRLDGIPLHEPALRDRLAVYLLRDAPLEACRWCLGTSGVRMPHRMLTIDEVRHPAPADVSLKDVLDHAAMAASLEAVKPARSRTRSLLSASNRDSVTGRREQP